MVFGKSLNRRAFVTGLLTSGAAVASFPARAEDPISRAIQGAAIEWSDGFDAAASTAPDVRTFTPILSPEIIQSLEMAIAQYSDIVARGGWPMVPADKKMKIGGRGTSVTALRQRLMISGDPDPMLPSSHALDSYVDAAGKTVQAPHGIPADGVVGDSTFAALNVPAAVRLNQLSTNLTRLKMQMAKVPPGGRFVMVNIPAASVEAVEADRVVSRHTAVAGKVDRPSPIVNSKITEINFHPFWTVPASIIRKDLIPMMQKKPSYLTDYRIRVYDQKGNELQPQQINWNSDEATRYLFRQDPFDGNSLGTVKINFPSPDGVYMHDTPNKGLFNNEFRFDSSGCVRIQNIRDLIVWILRDTPGQTPEAIDAEFRDGQRRDVRVTNPVPVFWTYFTAWAVSDGVVHFRNDVYGLDGLEQYTAQATPL